MKLTTLQSVYDAEGPFTSVCLDVSRTEAESAHQLELRWRAVREQLDDASGQAVDLLESRLLEPTGFGGELTRIMVVSGDGTVVLDELHGHAVPRDHAHVGALPHLMPAARARWLETRYLLVTADHKGADIVVVDGTGLDPQLLVSEGGHDVLHKVPGGGWSHRRYQSRAEDSWERNAEQVADDLDKVVARHRPEVVLLTGEAYSKAAVRDAATGRVAERLVDLEHGARQPGASEDAVHAEVADVLARHRAERTRQARDLLAERLGRDEAAVAGFDAVVGALRAGAVDTLLLCDDPSSTLRLFAGEQALQIGRRRDEVEALGATDVGEDRADEVMLRALVGQDASLVLVDDEDADLKDGIGALLRFDTRP